MANNYKLLENNDSTVSIDIVDKAITKALTKCAKKIQEIDRTHPGFGLGDTDTDECIADEFYAKIHWSRHEWS